MTLDAGDVLFIKAGAVHTARNVGLGPCELATYIVEKGKPLVSIAASPGAGVPVR